MEYNSYLKECRNDDVICLSNKLYKLEDFKRGLNDYLENQDSYSASYGLSEKLTSSGIDINRGEALLLLTEGTDSEILKIASDGWKKGKLKIKVSVEFIPEEPEIPEYQSPLDEIRNHPSFPNS
jgi:hypothetical protein